MIVRKNVLQTKFVFVQIIGTCVFLSLLLMSTAVFATSIPIVTKALLTDDAKAVIEVKLAGSSNTLYMYQVAEKGYEKDCADSSDAKQVKGCRVAVKERNRPSYVSGSIQNGKGGEFRYRVAAFDPSGGNPKNSGWSSWQTLYVVTGINPQQGIIKGQKTNFIPTSKGTAPSTLKFTLRNENCDPSNSFACTPQTAGTKEWIVADKPGGITLAKGSISIIEPPNSGMCKQIGPYSPDPDKWWEKWQAGSSAVHKTELRDGKVFSMSPAEIIYWSSKENSVNPILAMAKIQGESSLIEKRYSSGELATKLFMATGYGARKNQRPWKGFYPQVVGLTYQIDLDMRKNNKNVQSWFNGYTQDNNAANYATFTGIYKKYATDMNKIAGTSHSLTPNTKGYLEDFNSITINQIQMFLNKQNGSLANSKLFCNDHQ